MNYSTSVRVFLVSCVLLLLSKDTYSNDSYEISRMHNPMLLSVQNHPMLEKVSPRGVHPRHFHHHTRKIGSSPKYQRRPYLRTEKSLHHAGLSAKERLSAKILEEIESLDALKCLPKALCSISAESSINSHALLKRPNEIKKLNDKFVNDYLSVMHSVVEPDHKNEKLALSKTRSRRPLAKPKTQQRQDTEEESEENSSEEEEESFAESRRRPQRYQNHRDAQMNKLKGMYYKKRFKTQWESVDMPQKGFRVGHGPHGQKGKRRRPNHRDQSYSQQYHYMSASMPVAAASDSNYAYHGGYPDKGHEDPSTNPSSQYSFSSMILYFVPSFFKKIFSMVLPSFTFEFTPEYDGSESQMWSEVVSPPPKHNIFAEDPFFDGFRSNIHQFNQESPFEFSSRSRKTGPRSSPTTTVDDFMLDARDRFLTAIEIGQTFKSLRKCKAIYSTCPFTHTQVVDMIEIIKQKLHLQDLMNSRMNHRRKRKMNRKNAKKN